MECGAEYSFTSPEQFFAELQEIISISPNNSSLDELDYALRNYVAFASTYMDEFLPTPDSLDFALQSLLISPLFTSHPTRMTYQIISLLNPIIGITPSNSQLFITLMLILELGLSNPLAISDEIRRNSTFNYNQGTTSFKNNHNNGNNGNSRKLVEENNNNNNNKVFKAVRSQWSSVVKVLIQCVQGADVTSNTILPSTTTTGNGGSGLGNNGIFMPESGWEERLGTAATAVLYQVCRVQKLTLDELAVFSYEFISHLFKLVEKTRDAEDETFNYTLIALIIALNEQYMVSSLPPPSTSSTSTSSTTTNGNKILAPHGHGILVEPILPTISSRPIKSKGKGKEIEIVGGEGKGNEKENNLVLRVLRNCEGDSKTFGENIIFILNRANGSNDSLCTSLLILKILYLLFTTKDTQEYFYTNDLCVLVDVFIRELCDLDDDSEGLKHTYLRVLHPLLTNTQLKNHPYKRPQLYKVLKNLISTSNQFTLVDSTTKRLVERNLKSSWCEGLNLTFNNNDSIRSGSEFGGGGGGGGEEGESIRGWSSGMGGRRENSLSSQNSGISTSNITTTTNNISNGNGFIRNKNNSIDQMGELPSPSPSLILEAGEGGRRGEEIEIEIEISEKIKSLRLEGGNITGKELIGISREGSTDSVDLVASTKDYGTGRRKLHSYETSSSSRVEAGEGEGKIEELKPSISIISPMTTTNTSNRGLNNNLELYSNLPRSSSPLSFPPIPSSESILSTSSTNNNNNNTTIRSNSIPSLNGLLIPIPPLAEINRRRSSSLLPPTTLNKSNSNSNLNSTSYHHHHIERPNSTTPSINHSHSHSHQSQQQQQQQQPELIPNSPQLNNNNNKRRKAPPPPSSPNPNLTTSHINQLQFNQQNDSNLIDSCNRSITPNGMKNLPNLPSSITIQRRAAPEPPIRNGGGGGRRE